MQKKTLFGTLAALAAAALLGAGCGRVLRTDRTTFYKASGAAMA